MIRMNNNNNKMLRNKRRIFTCILRKNQNLGFDVLMPAFFVKNWKNKRPAFPRWSQPTKASSVVMHMEIRVVIYERIIRIIEEVDMYYHSSETLFVLLILFSYFLNDVWQRINLFESSSFFLASLFPPFLLLFMSGFPV